MPMSNLPLMLPPVALELLALGAGALGQGRSDPLISVRVLHRILITQTTTTVPKNPGFLAIVVMA